MGRFQQGCSGSSNGVSSKGIISLIQSRRYQTWSQEKQKRSNCSKIQKEKKVITVTCCSLIASHQSVQVIRTNLISIDKIPPGAIYYKIDGLIRSKFDCFSFSFGFGGKKTKKERLEAGRETQIQIMRPLTPPCVVVTNARFRDRILSIPTDGPNL